MHTPHALYFAARSPRARRLLDRLAQEISALLDALTSPGKLVDEVESMHRQHAVRSRRS